MPPAFAMSAPIWLEAAVASRELHCLRNNFDVAIRAANFATKIAGGMKLATDEALWQDLFSTQMADLAAIPTRSEEQNQDTPASAEGDTKIDAEDVFRILQLTKLPLGSLQQCT